MNFLTDVALILVVIAIFNVIIFVHELGHFLAAKWRGVQVDRFQIWFGKPIWKKEFKGVQYGLGWIPAGGFVALPQMAPMESVEGGNRDAKQLPKISPLDKIIVAFAGPLFSLLLALAIALIVWKVGKPQGAITNTIIGAVVENSPAEEAGLKPGDRILEVNGDPVRWFAGDFNAVSEKIMLTKSDEIHFKVERDGKTLELTSKFEIAETSMWQRRALPRVGIRGSGPAIIQSLSESSNPGPAERAGLQVGDEVVSLNGEKIYGIHRVFQLLRASGEKPVTFEIKRGDEILEKVITPLIPKGDYYEKPMIGCVFDPSFQMEERMIYPNPFAQVKDSLTQMWVTISSVASPKSKVGVDQLAGPLGIGHMKFRILSLDGGLNYLLALLVLFNVNLAVLNMLPFPVLDGGHIVMALWEMITRKPLNTRFLEVVQTGFALLLFSFMIFISTKDVGAMFDGKKGPKPPDKIVWPDGPAKTG